MRRPDRPDEDRAGVMAARETKAIGLRGTRATKITAPDTSSRLSVAILIATAAMFLVATAALFIAD
jgi:hypothetical protein